MLSGGAVSKIANSQLKELVVTDSIQPTEAVKVAGNIRVVPIAPLIGEAIARIAREESVSSLFDEFPFNPKPPRDDGGQGDLLRPKTKDRVS